MNAKANKKFKVKLCKRALKNPDHYIYKNRNSGYYMSIRFHFEDGTQLHQKEKMGTHEVDKARQIRDRIFNQLEQMGVLQR